MASQHKREMYILHLALKKLSSHVDRYNSTFDNRVGLTYDLLTSESMHTERLPCAVCLRKFGVNSSSRLLLERGHTQSQTPLITLSTDRVPPASVDMLTLYALIKSCSWSQNQFTVTG